MEVWYIWSWSRWLWLSCVLFIYCSRIVCPLSCFQRWWTMSLIAKTWCVWQRQPLLGSGTCGKRYSTPHCVHPLNLEHLLFYHLTWGVGGQGEKSIGRFSEAGLHEWMPYIIIRARSRKRLQLPLPGRILIRCSVGLHCVTIEVKPRILKQCKCHNCCICKNYRGKVMEDGGKSVFALFPGWPEDREHVEKMHFLASYNTSCQTHSDCGPLKTPLKLVL